ncbi:MAG: alanine/glycine:cation symporter family protein [Planctomycetota bacterium]
MLRLTPIAPLIALALVLAATPGAPAQDAATEGAGTDPVEAVEGVLDELAGEAPEGESAAPKKAKQELPAWQQQADDIFGSINDVVAGKVFYPVPFVGLADLGEVQSIELSGTTEAPQVTVTASNSKAKGSWKKEGAKLVLTGYGDELATLLGRDELRLRVTSADSDKRLDEYGEEEDDPAGQTRLVCSVRGEALPATALVGDRALPAGTNAAIPRTLPFAVVWLVIGATFFTLRMGFINLRGFKHAIDVVRGKFTDPNAHEAGEVSHFQALTTALSATVGLGNIAGVAIAVSIGGPGATFWMIAAGLLGMSSKFVECSLGQMYRQERADGHVMGGAMFYLSRGLAEVGLAGPGRLLAALFAVLCIGGSIAGGNSFQVNQSLGAIGATFPWLAENGWVYGLIMTVLAGVVIIGGIRRIANVAEKIVPTMAAVYVLAALTILAMNVGEIPSAFSAILSGAFSPEAGYGGFIGVLVTGFQRAAFSNEAGVGSAAIAHSAARTDYPVREGIVALLEPFIDTVVVCTMTALVIVITGAYANPDYAQFVAGNNGAALTSAAMGDELSFMPTILSVAVALFAFSTMISWSYYGERCWSYLFGEGSSIVYKLIFLSFTFLGSILSATKMLEFGDTMILAMCIPNILGVYFLSGKVKRSLDEYWGKFSRGEFPTFK